MKSLVVLNECNFSAHQKTLLKSKFRNVRFFDDTSSEDLAIKRIGDSNIVVMDQYLLTLSEETFKQCKKIELVILNTTAYNRVDIPLLNSYNVKLAHLKNYATFDVAEIGIGMVMSLNNRTSIAQNIVLGKDIHIAEYVSRQKVDDIYPGHPIIPFVIRKPLKQQTFGVVGLGHIGQRSAELAMGLGMHVIGYNRSRKQIPNVENVSLRKLFISSDVIYISIAYDEKTMSGFINSELLSMAKDNSVLVSISDPKLIDMRYLIVHNQKFAGIGFDFVVSDEMRQLLQVRKHNIIITPALGHQSENAYSNMSESIIEIALSHGSDS